MPPIPMPSVEMINRLLRGLEDERAARDGLGGGVTAHATGIGHGRFVGQANDVATTLFGQGRNGQSGQQGQGGQGNRAELH